MQPGTKRLLAIGAAILVFLALVIAIPVGVTQSRKNSSTSSLAAAAAEPSGSDAPSAAPETKTTAAPAASATVSAVAVTGKTGSLVKLSNGTDVAYTNTFGGDWAWDETDPYAKKQGAFAGGRAQEWSPRTGETWEWGVDQVRGVSIGLIAVFCYLSRADSAS